MILIVDFGAQYAQLIRRAVNDLGAQAHVVDAATVSVQPPVGTAGVILSGGPASVHPDALNLTQRILSWKTPVLGICFGHQLLAAIAGGTVAQQVSREYGRANFRVTRSSPLTTGLPLHRLYHVWMSHGDSITSLPVGAWVSIGETDHGRHAAIANETARLYGVQFHPEVTQTECGLYILRNFVTDICRSPRDFTAQDLVQEISDRIRKHVVGTDHILVAGSLGVDSTTVATLCARALGQERVHTVFVDNGLHREEDLELATTAHAFLPNLIIEHTEDLFLDALEGISDGQEKRRMIGTTFWKVFQAVAERLGARFPIAAFTQGTLAPDVIESGASSTGSDLIKIHHNLVSPPPTFPFPPFEPLRILYKDQVRALGRAIGVPDRILSRHPFPGPGLAIRVDGPVTRERVRIARACDAIFMRRLKDGGYYDAVSQALVVVQQGSPVCVQGDARTRGCPVQLRAFTTRDFMTADVALLFTGFLAEVSDEIMNSVKGVGNVNYNTTRKPPGTIEWE
ncbi:MAG: glutamine-hydrolyzing GMP synthase [bacterium]|nr:glutamine-hydrolyzing GMP synthase [bacterium]